jgi:hypothetical protein
MPESGAGAIAVRPESAATLYNPVVCRTADSRIPYRTPFGDSLLTVRSSLSNVFDPALDRFANDGNVENAGLLVRNNYAPLAAT